MNLRRAHILLIAILAIALSACRNNGKFFRGTGYSADSAMLKQYIDSANVLFDVADYRQSLEVAKQAVDMGRELRDTVGMTDGISTVVCAYQQLGILDSAIINANILLEIDKVSGDASMLSSDYNNLAYIHVVNKQYELAMELAEKAIEMERMVDGSPHLGIRYGVASEAALNLSKDSTRKDRPALQEQSLRYITMAYDEEAARKDTIHMGRRLSQKGDVLAAMNRNKEAVESYKAAIAILQPRGERHSLAITYRQLGTLFLSEKNNAMAISYLEKAAAMTKDDGELPSLMRIYQSLHKAYEGVDLQKSNDYLRLYTQVKDSVYTLESARSLSEFKARYETDKEREKTAEKHRQLILSGVLSLLAIAVVCGLAVWLYVKLHHRNRRNSMLQEQVAHLRKLVEQQQQQFLEQKREEERTISLSSMDSDMLFLEDVNDAIFKLMNTKELTAENIAMEMHITSQQLRRRIKTIKDVTPLAYISSIRLGYARQLLKDRPELAIEQVAMLCGFYEATHFTRFFKKEMGGITPTQYRGEEE